MVIDKLKTRVNMLQPILHILQTKRIILASGSVRRKDILQHINFPFEVKLSNFEENLNKSDFAHPYEYAIENAKQKALAVAKMVAKDGKPADLVIGADTVVFMDNKILEKPQNKANAVEILSWLSGRTHTVYTGVALINQSKDSSDLNVTTFYDGTDVKMGNLTAEVIDAYVATGEPMDKAGGYGIQDLGATLVEGIKGDYYTVEGLPVYKLCCYVVDLFKN
uniref:Uncharacterized protein n=1 Tax=Strigamia maritima TaxID=126957 RepID=T1IPK6_STRMM